MHTPGSVSLIAQVVDIRLCAAFHPSGFSEAAASKRGSPGARLVLAVTCGNFVGDDALQVVNNSSAAAAKVTGDAAQPTATQSLRILIALHSFEPGGVERVAIRLVKAWQASGFDVRLLMGRAQGPTIGDYGDLSFDVVGRCPVSTAGWESIWMLLRLPTAIRRDRPDVLFCAGNTYAIIAVAMRLILRHNCPAIVAKISNDLVRHDLDPLSLWFYRAWLRLQARFIDQFVALSPAMAREIETLMRVPQDRVDVIADPALSVDDLVRLSRHTRQRSSESGATTYVIIGRLVRQKNVGLAIAAFARGRRDGERLIIVGSGPEKRRLQRKAQSLGVADQVWFVGHTDDVPAWLDLADVLVVSSDYEGLPAVVIEALAAGRPVVATDCTSSMRDLLDDGRFGIVVPRGDAKRLSQAMRLALIMPFDSDDARMSIRQHTLEHGSQTYIEVMRRCHARHVARRG